MKTKIEKLWLENRPHDGELEIRTDWSNDRHHAVVIRRPQGKKEVAEALFQLAHFISKDTGLDS